jgi:hypothetical protein
MATVQIKQVTSPTLKRTEGRAPVWGLELTINVAPRGDTEECAPGLNSELWDMVTDCLLRASLPHRRFTSF